MLNNKTVFSYVLVFIFGLLASNIYFSFKDSLDKDSSRVKINTILTLIEENYVDEFSLDKYESKVINSIMSYLDPHTSYIPKKEFSYVEDRMSGSFSGVGIEFNIVDDTLLVVSPISGGPSEQLGIKSGDKIIKVDGENIANIGLTNDDVFEKLRGEKGSKVEVVILREGDSDLLYFDIIRGDIPMYSVDASFLLRDKIGYLKLNRFSATTNQEFYERTQSLLNKGMNKMVLDLRGNPGGYLGSAIYICNEFLNNGDLILFTEGRNRNREDFFSDHRGELKEIELVILINEGSASASEIVSGCMQDNDRAIIVGNRSFGKGLVQEEIKLNDGSAIHVTTQRYYIPSGRSIQKPYEKNNEDYSLEIYNRPINKQTKMSDSLKFFTRSGRIVYEGGGITPDSIIYIDSTLDYSTVNFLQRNNFIMDFSFHYIGKNDISSEKDLNTEEIFNKFRRFVLRKDPDFDFTMGVVELSYLKNYIKAVIAKNLIGEESYYNVLAQEDEYIQKALEIFSQ